jgi:hypothetical protein
VNVNVSNIYLFIDKRYDIDIKTLVESCMSPLQPSQRIAAVYKRFLLEKEKKGASDIR